MHIAFSKCREQNSPVGAIASARRMMICQTCYGFLQRATSKTAALIQASQFSTTQTLEKKKKIVRPKHSLPPIGVAFKRVTGQAVKDRYGPFVDKPDYTFLDGRPTPLTPEQIKLREERKEIAASVVAGIKEVTNIRTYNEDKLRIIEQERQRLLDAKLKPKS